MQVNLLWTAAASRGLQTARSAGQVASSSRDAWLSGPPQLLAVSSDERADREQIREADRDEKQRRREVQLHDLAQTASAAPRPSDVIIKAERNMLPGSRAARQEVQTDQARHQANESRRDFRQALADASVRGRAEHAPATPSAETESTAPPKTDQPRSADPTASRTASPSPAQSAADTVAGPPQPSRQPAGVARNPQVPAGNLRVATVSSGGARSAEPDAASAAKLTTLAKPSVVAIRATGPAIGQPGAAATGTLPRSGSNTVAPVTAARSGTAPGKSAAATPTSEPASGNSDAHLARIVRLIQSRLGRDRSVATFRLNPPDLGSLRLRLDLRQEQLSLQIDAQTPAARRLLSDQLDVLRRSLEAAGIQLDHVEVRGPARTDPPGRTDTPPQSDSWTPNQEGPAHDPSGSAGGGPPFGTDAPPAPPAAPLAHAATPARSAVQELEPAAESLVNLWA